MHREFIDLLDHVSELHHHAKIKGHSLWFRGHRKAEWQLRSSLHRCMLDAKDELGGSLEGVDIPALLRETEKTLYYRFRQRGWQLHSPGERSPWGLVFSMQHHGVPTRLLDWTQSFLYALYFAQSGRAVGEAAAIFVLDADGLNDHVLGVPGLVVLDDEPADKRIDTGLYLPTTVRGEKPLPPLAVAPVLTNARMVAQQTAFLLCGDSLRPLEEEFPVFRRLLLSPETYDDARHYLELAGISRSTLFPDLQGLAEDLAESRLEEIRFARSLVTKRGSADAQG